MSALPPKADKQQNVRLVPKADFALQQSLFDPLGGAREQPIRGLGAS
jgi:hypothetical protein